MSGRPEVLLGFGRWPGLESTGMGQAEARCQAGDSIAIRHSSTGGVRFVESAVVVEDTGDRVLLYRPVGSELKVPPSFSHRGDPEERDRVGRQEVIGPAPILTDATWEATHALLHFEPGDWYSTWLFWSAADHSFLGYYVNFELPWRRTSVGFDTNDLTLDVVVAPDLSWRWKDQQEYEDRLAAGAIPERWADAVAVAREAVLAKIAAAAAPFDGSLLSFAPDPAWPIPTVPREWASVPVIPGPEGLLQR